MPALDAYPINFDHPPPLGTTVRYYRGRVLTLVEITSRTRRDGTPGTVLVWETGKGRRCTSGLRSKAVTWPNGAV